jgi:hypothetical protein
MLTESPVENGIADGAVAVTVLVVDGVVPVHANARVSVDIAVVAVRSTLGEPPESGVAGVVVIE